MNFKQQYFDCWRAVWEFHKKYFAPPESDEEWQQLVNESEKIAEQWEDKPQARFVKSLLLAVIDEIEKRDKERR